MNGPSCGKTPLNSRLKVIRRWVGRALPWRKPPPVPIVPRPELWPKVQAILAECSHIRPGEITPQAHLVDDLGLDSLHSIELVMAVEEEFGIEIPDDVAEKLLTVPALLQYLEERLRDGDRPDR